MPSPGWATNLNDQGIASIFEADAESAFNTLQAFAHSHVTTQLTNLNNLVNIDILPVVPPDIDYEEAGVVVPKFQDDEYTVSSPSNDIGDTVFPPDPNVYHYESIPIPSIPSFPAFDIPDVVIEEPEEPDDTMPQLTETAPPLVFSPTPDAPPLDFPDPIEVTPIFIPDLPVLDFPDFEGVRPDINLVAPVIIINDGNFVYQSDLLDAVREKLLYDVINGGTGLGADIEQDIWERNQERDQLALADSMTRATSEWSARGFNYPNGILGGMLIPLEVEYMHKRTDTSRDIAIEQAKLAQTNTHFAIQQGLAFEQMWINWQNSIAQRTFEASKAYAEALLKQYSIELDVQKTLIEQYKADAQVFAERIKGEIAKLENVRIQAEINKNITESDRNRVEVYKAQVDAMETIVKSYGHEVEAVKVVAETQKIKMEAFKAAVEAYVAQINAKTAEYNMYTAAWTGQKTKADVYATRVDAYSKRVAVVQSEFNTNLEYMRSHIEANKDTLSQYTAELDFFKSKSANAIAYVDEKIKKFNAEVARYQTDGSIFNNQRDLTVKKFELEINKHLRQAELLIKEAELQLKADEFNVTQTIETRKAVATLAAHVASGALASCHASATLSASANAGHNYSRQDQAQNSGSYDVRENYSYSE